MPPSMRVSLFWQMPPLDPVAWPKGCVDSWTGCPPPPPPTPAPSLRVLSPATATPSPRTLIGACADWVAVSAAWSCGMPCRWSVLSDNIVQSDLGESTSL